MNVGNNRMTNDGSTILVYCSITNERLRYIVEQVFESKATITNSVDEFNQFDGYKINYSDQQKRLRPLKLSKLTLSQFKLFRMNYCMKKIFVFNLLFVLSGRD